MDKAREQGVRCVCNCKDTNLKAIHNQDGLIEVISELCLQLQRY